MALAKGLAIAALLGLASANGAPMCNMNNVAKCDASSQDMTNLENGAVWKVSFPCHLTASEAGALASGSFKNGVNSTGWGYLKVSTPSVHSTSVINAYAAGYLEGVLTSELIGLHAQNFQGHYPEAKAPMNASVKSWFESNLMYMSGQITMKANNSNNMMNATYWSGVRWQLVQLAGMRAGYEASGNPMKLDFFDFFALSAMGDMDDILAKLFPTSKYSFPKKASKAAQEDYFNLASHCSAMVRFVPDNSDIMIGHDMWWEWYAMILIFKVYDFPVVGVATNTIMMSSYPAALASIDDWYQMPGSHMASMETTNVIFDNSIRKYQTTSSVLYWLRIMNANRFANSGRDWMIMAGKENSGTYNNQWMVLDWKKFTPGAPLNMETFYVGEQFPGLWVWADQSTLLQDGFWPSYNIAFYEEAALWSGQAQEAVKNPRWAYSGAPRSHIFRRDAFTVQNMSTFETFLRYNRFNTDPLFPKHNSGWDAIAARGDLTPGRPQAAGATDGTISSYNLMLKSQARIIAGPTHQEQPKFCWSKAPAAVQAAPHVGQPDCFDFHWLTVDATQPCLQPASE